MENMLQEIIDEDIHLKPPVYPLTPAELKVFQDRRDMLIKERITLENISGTMKKKIMQWTNAREKVKNLTRITYSQLKDINEILEKDKEYKKEKQNE